MNEDIQQNNMLKEKGQHEWESKGEQAWGN